MTKNTAAPADYIQLHRTFIHWTDDTADYDTISRWERTHRGSLTWAKLLEHRRVVVLAEPGSGKSKELEHQAQVLTDEGKPSFFFTVEDAARDGVEATLTPAQRTKLAEWKASSDHAYFFVDSVDEAKADAIRIELALRKLAEAVDGALDRVTIVLSSRYMEWELVGDLKRLKATLPVPDAKREDTLSPPELLTQVLDNEFGRRKKGAPETEEPLVVVMASLDKDQVRTYAKGRGIQKVDEFTAALDEANLWDLAHRPVDLGWLVDYWQNQGRFGPFAEMLETSLQERLREHDPIRRQKDTIPEADAMQALERIGAAMVFGQVDKIVVPDSEVLTGPNGLHLERVLPDWSEANRSGLRFKSVFDPATSDGRVRLHNDNEGKVRGFLAAKWLKRRRDKGTPVYEILRLFFTETYGLNVVRPSTVETAAWLSIWDEDVARGVIARDPSILLKGGDPASLPTKIRIEALKAVIAELLTDDERHLWHDLDAFRRFATPDLAPTIRELWNAHASNREVQHLLLQLMWLGKLTDCYDLAQAVVFAEGQDRTSRILAARLLHALGSDDAVSRYTEAIKSNPNDVTAQELSEAIEHLFPVHITPEDLAKLLASLNWEDRQDDYTRSLLSSELINRINDPQQIEGFLGALIDLSGKSVLADEHDDETEREKALFPILHETANRLASLSKPDGLPNVVIRAAIRLGEKRAYGFGAPDLTELHATIHSSDKRRRAALWLAYEALKDSPHLHGNRLVNAWQMEFLGWPAGLQEADFDWLIEDIAANLDTEKGRFALASALSIWQVVGKPADLLKRLEAVAKPSEPMTKLVQGWSNPEPPSKADLELRKRHAAARRRQAVEKAKRDKSWMKFADELKANPDQLRNPPIRNDDQVDPKLFYFWRFANGASGENRYEIDDLSPLAPLFGQEVIAAGTDGLIKFWRERNPQLESERAPDKRNTISMFDCMGIAGISLEAKRDPDWARKLTSDEATLAAAFATLELNGFPTWFADLVREHPSETTSVLMRDIEPSLAPSNAPVHGTIQDVSYANIEVSKLIAPSLFAAVRGRPDIAQNSLGAVMTILANGLTVDVDRQAFLQLAIERFKRSPDAGVAASYLYGAFSVDAAAGLPELADRLDTMNEAEQKEFAEIALPRVFGDDIRGGGISLSVLSFDVLERLLGIAYRTVRTADDVPIVSGQVYSIDGRRSAERARSLLFNKLVETPGAATVSALRRVAPLANVAPAHLQSLIVRRAANDSEMAPWPENQASAMEEEFDTVPQTPKDLQKVAMNRLADLSHDLRSHDFAQGRTLKRLPSEQEVQIWVANNLDAKRKRAYTVDRETEMVDAKKPDIRLKSGNVGMPIEIKVAEDWSLTDLEDALFAQLGSRYLKHQDAKHGILLLVHQAGRPQGWHAADGSWLDFLQVVNHLKQLAAETAGVLHESAQALIAVLDVSDITLPEDVEKPRAKRGRPKGATPAKGRAAKKPKP